MSQWQRSFRMLVVAVLCTTSTDGKRIQMRADQDGSKLGLKSGDVIDGLTLQQHVGNAPMKGIPALAVNAPTSENALLEQKNDLNVEDQLKQWEAGSKVEAFTGRPLVDIPASLSAKLFAGPPVHLAAGSFGESWLVTGAAGTPYAGQQVVAKFLYITKGRGYAHVTKRDISANPVLRKEVREAARECNFAKRLQKAALNMTASAHHAQRLMNCYSHNFMKKTPSSHPIYLVLQNCGKQDLGQFIKANAHQMDAELMGSITRQIVEGLDYLAQMQPLPVIHHDLKPANVVVKAVAGSRIPLVYLIDYGAMMEADPKKITKSTVATSVFAPPEWFRGQAFRFPATSFDMYAVGNILADMATGAPFGSRWYDDKRDEPKFDVLDQIYAIDDPKEFVDVFRKNEPFGLLSMEENAAANAFMKSWWAPMIDPSPKKRPTPAQILGSDWISASASPNDDDWVMYTPPTPAMVVEEEKEDQDQESDGDAEGCLPACDLCLEGEKGAIKLVEVAGRKERRQKLVCAVETENVNSDWVRNGPDRQYCDKTHKRMKVGRNKHGKSGAQEYYTWDCAKMTPEEVKAVTPKVLRKPKRKAARK